MATRAIVQDVSWGGWFSADELAGLRLPGLPRSKRQINERAEAERWALRLSEEGAPLARRRQARGGGTEYHSDLLPAAARAELVKRDMIAAEPADDAHPLAANDEQPTTAWAWYDRQSAKVKAEAERRVSALTRVIDYEAAGFSRTAALAEVSTEIGASTGTLYNWLKLVAGLAPIDWPPALAPMRKGGGAEAEIDSRVWECFKGDYLRLSKPTIAACYRRAQDYAASIGITILPAVKTFQRRMDREVSPYVQIKRRQGEEAMRRSFPSQTRTVAHLHAMELVNIDGHKFDVWVDFGPDAQGKPMIKRPIMVAIQDVYSRKMLAWRIGEVESAIQTRLAFADLFRNFGIPKGCLLDNGRAFASKWITGGAMLRNRFKVLPEDPTGLLPALGINPHWAKPYRGQSKPIERFFRDLAEEVAKHPACEGAYTGNNPTAKPENYGSRAVPLDEFKALVATQMARLNARPGRRAEAAAGRSFDEAFAESYAVSAIGQASPEQLRLALLAGEKRRIDKNTGQIEMLGNRYFSLALERHYGQLVTVRFDPDNLHDDIHVYDLAGHYICAAPVREPEGFLTVEAGKRRAKEEAEVRRKVRELEAAHQILAANKIAEMLPSATAEPVDAPKVVRPVRHAGQVVHQLRTTQQRRPAREIAEDAFQDDFMAGISRLRPRD